MGWRRPGGWRRALPGVLGLVALPSPAIAQDMPATPTPPMNAQHRDENGKAAGTRAGAVKLTPTYIGDLAGDARGGMRTGVTYMARIGLIGDADLDSLIGWHGATAHISVHGIFGEGLSQHRVGNLLTVSGIEAEPAFRLFNLWIDQKIGSKASLRVGQFTAGQEFAISNTANLFVNSTFGWPASFATDLPSGGPAYPLAAPGARLAIAPDARTMLRLAIFAGDPAGPGGGDPQRRDLHGLNGLRFAGRPFLIGEVERSSPGDDPALTVRAGGWLHLNDFADLARDDEGQSLAAPGSSGQPLQHRGNVGLYGIADMRLWRSAGVAGRGVRGFVRGSFSPSDRNMIDLYLDGGVAMTAPLRSRPNDVVGIGVAVARISPRLRDLARTQIAAGGGAPLPLPDVEGVVELSYQAQIRANISVQPNVQYVAHPGGGAAAASGMGRVPDAVVIGVRTAARF